ncbi:MAG: zinc ribbon domain-containing protein [Phycisphaerae bacterium]|jgi:hypothetical protein|nr:zinc ribbon domain-containing protein [Phycisphaerae bacterium]
MGTFRSTRTFFHDLPDLAPVVDDVARHFTSKGYEVSSQQRIAGDWDISLTKGNLFRSVCGLRTALKIELSPQPGSVLANAGVGIFGQQAIPSAISFLVFWPIAVTQIWGLITQAKLDDEALDLIGESMESYARRAAPPFLAGAQSAARFCPACGQALPPAARFCPGCGNSLN